MTASGASDWFLDRDGNKSGPFTAEQVQNLLNSGEINEQHKVTAEWLCGEWITVADLIAGYKAAQVSTNTAPAAAASAPIPTTAHSSGPFHPPPRPPELEQPDFNATNAPMKADTTIELFDVLQAAREKKAGKQAQQVPLAVQPIDEAPLWTRIPPRYVALGAAVAFGVALVGWAVNRLTSSAPAPTPTTAAGIVSEPQRGQSAPGFRPGVDYSQSGGAAPAQAPPPAPAPAPVRPQTSAPVFQPRDIPQQAPPQPPPAYETPQVDVPAPQENNDQVELQAPFERNMRKHDQPNDSGLPTNDQAVEQEQVEHSGANIDGQINH